MTKDGIINVIKSHYTTQKPESLYEVETEDIALMKIVGMTIPTAKKEIVQKIQKHYLDISPTSYKDVDKEDLALMRVAGITIPSRKAKEDLDYLDMAFHDKKPSEVKIDDMKKIIGLKYTFDKM